MRSACRNERAAVWRVTLRKAPPPKNAFVPRCAWRAQVVEKLAIPGVRRLVVVHPDTRRVEGVVSLSDVAAYLFL